jgi:nucleoside-diphosphate-sugar epimerase
MYVVEQLMARGEKVRAYCRRRATEHDALGVETILGDVRDPDATSAACQDVDVVFHTAAVAGIWGPWQHFYETNTLGTRHVIAGCLRHSVKRLVYTSSPSVTFDGRDQRGIDETAPYPKRWLCHYPHTKALAEQEVLAANGRDGLATCSLRPHLIWGPRDRQLVPRVIERARQGKLMRVGDGQNLIDMVYVENAAAAHVHAAEHLTPGSPVAGKAYFISQGAPVNCWQWIDDLLAQAGLPPVKRSIPTNAAYALGAVLETAYSILRKDSEPRMTRFLALQLGKSHYFDISRARRDFGYEARVSTNEGMCRLATEYT